MIDPTKPIDFSKSRLVNGYAQEIVQQKVNEERKRHVFNMKNMGLTIDAISKYLQLPEKEVESLLAGQ